MNVIVMTGLRRGLVVSLGPRTLIGRGEDVQVRLPDHLLSSTHAEIYQEGDAYKVRDLGSTNSTFKNGLRVRSEAPLTVGDVLNVGRTELVFTDQASLSDARTSDRLSAPLPVVSDDAHGDDSVADATIALPIFQRVERRLTQAPTLDAFLERLARHFANTVDAKGAHISLASASGPATGLRVTFRDGVATRAGPGAFSTRADFVSRAFSGQVAALLGHHQGERVCCLALPSGASVVAAVYLHGIRPTISQSDLGPLVHLSGLVGVHCRTHMLVVELQERNQSLAETQAKLQEAVKKRTAELADSEASYQELFEESRDGNLLIDQRGRIAMVNPAAARILEADVETLRGEPAWAILDPNLARTIMSVRRTSVEDTQSFTLAMLELQAEAPPAITELPIVTNAGNPRVVEALVRPVTNAGLHVILRDATARFEAERRTRLLSRIVESVPEAVVTTSLDGVVSSWNPGAERLYGHAAAETVGTVLPTVPDDKGSELERILAAVADGRSLTLRTHRITQSEELVPVLLTYAPVPDASGTIVEVVELAHDLRDQLQLEERMRWGERMASFGELATGLAHELGNPLASLRGGVDFLLDRSEDPEDRDSLALLQRELERLQRLVEQTLSVARWALPKLAPVDASAVLSAVIELVQPQAESLGVTLHRLDTTDPLQILGDADQLEQLLLNLINNAFQAMPDGGTLGLGVIESPERDRAGYVVADTGQGVAAEDVERIFDLFFSKHRGGSGVGLAVVKRIVDLHQGEISLQSDEESGTTIRALFPTPPSGKPEPRDEESSA